MTGKMPVPPKQVPAPSAKNSYMAGGIDNVSVGADLRVRPGNDNMVGRAVPADAFIRRPCVALPSTAGDKNGT